MSAESAVAGAVLNATENQEAIINSASSGWWKIKSGLSDLSCAALSFPKTIGDNFAAATIQLGNEASHGLSSAYKGTVNGFTNYITKPVKSAAGAIANTAVAYKDSVADGADVIRDGVVGGAAYVAATAAGAYNTTVDGVAGAYSASVDGVKNAYETSVDVATNYKNEIIAGAGILKEEVGTHLHEAVVTPTISAIQDVTGTTELKEQVAALQRQLSELRITEAPVAGAPLPISGGLTLPHDEIIDYLPQPGLTLTSGSTLPGEETLFFKTSDITNSPSGEFLKNSNIVRNGTPEIRELKELLNFTFRLNLVLNEELDANTIDAIKEFQKVCGIKVDGIVGKETKAEFSKMLFALTNYR